MKRTILTSVIFLLSYCFHGIYAQVDPDAFGWAVCSSSCSFDDFCLDGGASGRVTVLRADGADMAMAIDDALHNYDVVIFDGSAGEFILSSQVALRGLKNKTIAGINGARLRTEFHVTDEIRNLLDSLDVNSLSSNSADGGGGTLPNGQTVAEECEYNIRLALMELYGSDKETYRKAGIFEMNGCSNIVVRNLEFIGPGSLDVGGSDLVTLSSCRNVWFDHCHFIDGLDGNMDIISGSSLITVSWCLFDYTERSYNHQLCNLISGKDGVDEDNLHITWAFCRWGSGSKGRMPWVHYGTDHILNCHYSCKNGTCVSGSSGARLRVEGCYFDSTVKKPYADLGTGALTWQDNILEAHVRPGNKGNVTLGYNYDAIDAALVPETIAEKGGATLAYPFVRELSSIPSEIAVNGLYVGETARYSLNISCFPSGDDAVSCKSCSLSASPGILLSADGENYSSTLEVSIGSGYLNTQVQVLVGTDAVGPYNGEITVDCFGKELVVPVYGEAIPLGESLGYTEACWPFDKGDNNARACESAIAAAFGESTYTIGANLYQNGIVTPKGAKPMTMLNPVIAIPRYPDDDSFVCFSVVTTDGMTFFPERLVFNACRVGTDMSAIDVVANSGGIQTTLLRGAQPLRHGDFSTYTLDMKDVRPSSRLDITLYIYYLSVNKQVGIGDICVEGRLFSAPSGLADPDYEECGIPVCFDLNGMRIPHPEPGRVNIVNGRKVAVPF